MCISMGCVMYFQFPNEIYWTNRIDFTGKISLQSTFLRTPVFCKSGLFEGIEDGRWIPLELSLRQVRIIKLTVTLKFFI